MRCSRIRAPLECRATRCAARSTAGEGLGDAKSSRDAQMQRAHCVAGWSGAAHGVRGEAWPGTYLTRERERAIAFSLPTAARSRVLLSHNLLPSLPFPSLFLFLFLFHAHLNLIHLLRFDSLFDLSPHTHYSISFIRLRRNLSMK